MIAPRIRVTESAEHGLVLFPTNVRFGGDASAAQVGRWGKSRDTPLGHPFILRLIATPSPPTKSLDSEGLTQADS